MFGYEVEIKSNQTHYEHDGEQYGSWSAESKHSLGEVRQTAKYPDVVTPVEYKPGDTVFVVWATWDAGDSFGNHTNASAEAVGIFSDLKVANELKSAIEEHGKQCRRGNGQFDCTTSDGQTFEYGSAPWSDYFGGLNSVNIDARIVK